MTPTHIDRVFGRGRLKMVTGEHVEVFREAVGPGERRRYTKRFLNTNDGNFAHWTEREWRILARLIGHGIDCVPDVVQFDRGSIAGTQLVQTYDAGATVDQWATLLPLNRDGRVYRHAFEDCAHWWALAHHSLVALKKIHQLELVHLDVKGDNVCIPLGPAHFDPDTPGERLHPVFPQLALIDFAFALVSGEALAHPLPIGWQRDYDYQSPRLLKALEEGRSGDLRLTCALDWRCDMYSLAAMLKRYLPDESAVDETAGTGWTAERYDAAKGLILSLRDHHDRDAARVLPHAALINTASARLRERDLAASLAAGWSLARDVDVVPTGTSPLTPMTRLAPSIRVFVSPHARGANSRATMDSSRDAGVPLIIPRREDAVRANARPSAIARPPLAAVLIIVAALGALAALMLFPDASRAALDRAWAWAGELRPHVTAPASSIATATPAVEAPVPTSTAKPAVETPLPAAATAKPDVEAPPPIATPTPIASAAPAISSPQSSVANETPMSTAQVPVAPAAAKRTSPPPKIASAAGKKQKNVAALPLPVQPARPTTPGKVAQHAVPPSAPNRVAVGVHGASTASIPVVPSSNHPSSIARAETRPAIAVVPSAVSSERAPAPAPTPSASTTFADAPSEPSVDRFEANASTDVAEAPTSPPPTTTRERTRTSRIEKLIDQGWLSKLLQLVNNKPAPIEDRRLQASAPKKPAAEAPSTAKPLAQAGRSPAPAQAAPKVAAAPAPDAGAIVREQIRGDAKTPSSAAWQPVELQEKIPAPNPPPMEQAALAPFPDPTPPGDADAVFASEARRALRDVVPRVATQAQAEVSRVLSVAANSNEAGQDRAVVQAAQWIRAVDGADLSRKTAPSEARRLNGEASDAYWSGRNPAETFELQLKAFGANPYDAEIAGNLALMHLKVGRSQPETARQLALIAIAYRGARSRTGRIEDWTTYAIASALTGRMADSRNAFLVTAALSPNIERSCKSALNALSNYGERLRDPVEAMFYRIHAQGRAYESPYCAWPRRWAMSSPQ
jgi:hypothetical protein